MARSRMARWMVAGVVAVGVVGSPAALADGEASPGTAEDPDAEPAPAPGSRPEAAPGAGCREPVWIDELLAQTSPPCAASLELAGGRRVRARLLLRTSDAAVEAELALVGRRGDGPWELLGAGWVRDGAGPRPATHWCRLERDLGPDPAARPTAVGIARILPVYRIAAERVVEVPEAEGYHRGARRRALLAAGPFPDWSVIRRLRVAAPRELPSLRPGGRARPVCAGADDVPEARRY